MADVTPRVGAEALIIQSYSPQGFRIRGADYSGAVLIAGGQVRELDVKSPSEIGAAQFALLKGLDVRYLIIGCGPTSSMLQPALLRGFKDMGIVAEGMSTGAACRTYNVLLAEQRPVAALLLPG